MQVAGGSNTGERRRREISIRLSIERKGDRERGRESDYSLTILFAACQTKLKPSRGRQRMEDKED